MSTHLVIATDGVIEHCTGDLRADPIGAVNAAVGPEGHDRVRLHPDHAVAAFVNDTGLFNPEKYPRNVVGSCLLVVLGAHPRPYAGPIVLTGWDAPMLLGYPTEIVPLGPTNVHVLADMHAQVLAALAHEDVRPDYPHEWAASVREVAEHVRTAPTPQVTLTTVSLDGPR